MFDSEVIRKHGTASICALLFSSICLLSAVGPVKANEASGRSADAAATSRSIPVMPLA